MAGHIWRFEGCEFDELRRDLKVDGRPVDIEVKPLDVLQQLLLHAGEIVTKEELLEAVWPGLVVVDASLATAVSKLRRALGSHADVIVTVPRIGYRFGVPVQRQAQSAHAWIALRLEAGQPVPLREAWRLARRLDQNPAGEVWLGENPKTHEQRVFKFAGDEAGSRALRREITLARLMRSALGERADFVRVLEWNLSQQPHFIESEYAGPDLRAWAELQGGLKAVELPRRLKLVEELARAVAAAHSLDILHKDLKPSNVMVATKPDGSPHVRVGDFGAASLLNPAQLAGLGITRLGFTSTLRQDESALSGTMMYLAPELLAGQSPTTASDVYALGVLLYQIVVGDFRRPLTAGWEQDVPDALLREDIALAADGDPARRLRSAADLAERLATLETRRAAQHRQQRVTTRRPARWTVPALLAGAAIAAVALGYAFRPDPDPAAAPARSLAVLPLQNLANDAARDHLRIALADEAATILSQVPGINVRPIALTKGHEAPSDPVTAGRDLGVDSVLTGHFREAGGRLTIALEAIDSSSGRLQWRDSFDVPAAGMVAAQVQLALRLRAGLAPAIGAVVAPAGSEPHDEAAYAMYLRSAALPSDAGPNRDGIALLEQAVALDERYAPAWQALSKRYYMEARYGGGGPALLERSEAAAERAIALDPGYVAPAAGLIVGRVERGELADAWRRAVALEKRRPDAIDAQFAMSYVLRFAGRLDLAAAHCEKAYLLDPRNHISGLRSCAIVFLLQQDYVRAATYLRLDEGSEFEQALTLHMLVAQGFKEEAQRVDAARLPTWGSFRLLQACSTSQSRARLDQLASAVAASDDAESNYFAASHLAYCGYVDAALNLLARAIEGGYCAYPALKADPLWANLRSSARYATLEVAGRHCATRFPES